MSQDQPKLAEYDQKKTIKNNETLLRTNESVTNLNSLHPFISALFVRELTHF